MCEITLANPDNQTQTMNLAILTFQALTLDLDFHVEWIDWIIHDDKGLDSNDSITLNPIFLNKIWSPDIFIGKVGVH